MSETYGLKIAYIIAGFIGGIVSLKFVQDLNRWAAVLAVFTGAAGANYGTPVLLHYMPLEKSLQYPAAFFVGLTALNLIPIVMKASEKFNFIQLIKK